MREIKFRAWNKEHGEMCYSMKTTLFEKREFYPFGIEIGFSHYPQEGWELMQYTGLKDRHGKEIYEGDFIKTKYDVVLIKNNGTNFYPYRNKDGVYNKVTNWESVKNGEVIGNIYENPLKGGDNNG